MPDPDTIAVPNLVGLAQPEAEAKLNDARLTVGTVTKVSSAMSPGSVSSASPAAGAIVSPGSAVNLEVSSGLAPVAVPDVVGLTRTAAETKLKNAGLVVGAVKTQPDDSVPAGGISETVPEAGTLISPGSEVELNISTGPGINWLQELPTVLFSVLGLFVLSLFAFIVLFENGHVFLTKLADKEVARGLITFLIAIATAGIAIILAISTLVLTEGDEGDKRFDRGKQVLTTLIGVLGTIVGFYFGSATERAPVSVPKITTTSLPVGAMNQAYPPTILQSAGLTTPVTWVVTPDLPAGLALDAKTGTISGTPAAASKTPLALTFTVTDSGKPPVSPSADLKLEIK
jgi:hypothetical protein